MAVSATTRALGCLDRTREFILISPNSDPALHLTYASERASIVDRGTMQFNLTATQRSALNHALSAHAPDHHVLVHQLSGAIDIARWRRAEVALAKSCALFRRSYLPGDEGWLIVEPPFVDGGDTSSALAVFDLSRAPAGTSLSLVEELVSRRFHPEEAPLVRLSLVLEAGGGFLVITAASFAMDRFSLRPLVSALTRAYAGEELSEIVLAQPKLLQHETEYLASPKQQADKQFWMRLLAAARFSWQPAKWSDATSPTFWSSSLSSQSTTRLSELAATLHTTLQDLLLFSFHLFLCKLTGDENILIASGHRAGSDADTGVGIGYCQQRVLLPSHIERATSVRDFLVASKRLVEYGRFHAGIPRGEVIRELQKKDPSLLRLTNVTFEEDLLPYGLLRADGLTITLLPAHSGGVDISDIAVTVTHDEAQQQALRFNISVRNPQHAAAIAAAFPSYFDLLNNLPDALDGTVGELSLLSDATRAQALAQSCGDVLSSPPRSVLDRFNDMVAQTPDAPALRCGDETYTYAQLSHAADKVAATILPLLSNDQESLIGICMTRGTAMIVSLLGVLKSGAGYLPLDPANPSERLSFILGDAGARAVLVDSKTVDIATQAATATSNLPSVLRIEEILQRPIAQMPRFPAQISSSVAYVIYTSGTTGKPKGVVVERGNAALFVQASETALGCGLGNRWLQFASLNFDASVLEIFNCLTRGAELVVAASEVRADPKALWTLLHDAKISHAFVPPAMLRVLPRQTLPDLANIYCGGEASDDATVAYWSNSVRLWNVYGPTETTVLCSANLLGPGRSASNLGRPLPGYTMYVLDERGEPTPTGGVGEIFIGGDGVTRGYFGRPELTATKFVPNPFGAGRLYRSGDLARRLPDGELEYLGRNDFQVKIRGFRIEIGDIESAIRAVAGVGGVLCTVVKGPGGATLAAWYTSTSTAEETVRDAISTVLPHYMVPTHLVRLDSFPVNISGKIDRSRLLVPDASEESTQQVLNPLQRQVRSAWADALKCSADGLGTASHFFHLGGHSLAASVACAKLSSQLGMSIRPRTLFEFPVLAAFCEQIAHAPISVALAPIVRTGEKCGPIVGALSSMMWNRSVQRGSDNTYTIVVRVDLDARVNPQTLRHALRAVIASDPIFRSTLREKNARLCIEEQDATAPLIAIVDCTEAQRDARIDAMRSVVFELATAPLWRAEILVCDDDRSVLLFAVHHAIFDGWSLNLSLEQLSAQYAAAVNGTSMTRTTATMVDYGIWCESPSHKDAVQTSVQYWNSKLRGVTARTELPITSSTRRADANAWLPVRVAPKVVAQLKRLASDLDVTLPPVLFSAYLVWLWRITGQRELTVSYPYAGRDVPGTDEIFGLFVTMGFLHQSIDADSSFASLVRHVAAQMISDREHLVASPYDTDLSAVGVPNVLFSLQSGINLSGTIGGYPFAAHEIPSRTSKADIGGIFYETADNAIEGRIEFDSSLLDPTLVTGFLRSLEALIGAASPASTGTLMDLPYLSDAERALITGMSTGPALEPCALTIVENFAQVVKDHPQRIAMECNGRSWTYTQLDQATDRLASALIARHHPVPQTLVGLSVSKSGELIQGALAILKAGCAYVPLDPHYPPDRLRYLIDDSGARLIIADASSADAVRATGASDLSFIDPFDSALEQQQVLAFPRVRPSDLAYVIYTSGSTGKPKGVLVEHHSVPRLMAASRPAISFTCAGRFVLLGTLNFDASVLQVFLPLLSGGTLVVPPPNIEKEPDALHQMLDQQRVTHALVTPSLIRNFPRRPLPHIEVLGFGGEAIDAASAEYWSTQTRFFSMYGPTEITVMCSAGVIAPGSNPRIIGRPLPGYTMHLLDRQMQLVPYGAVGEIFIGGGCDARGYLGKNELTMDRFVLDPFSDSPYARCYRSGDLGRFLSDGTIEYFGRNDDQIKLRGFRIELGEVESALQRIDGVTEAAAAVRGEGDLRAIVGYYTSNSGAPLDEAAVRKALAVFLPEYMLPSFLVHLAAFPLNANGKLDRKALPAVSMRSQSGDPPRAGLESDIAQVWEELLRFKGVGRDDDFFHLGGNSLLAARLQTLLRERLQLQVSIATLYAKPTIAALAHATDAGSIAAAIACARAGVRLDHPIAQGPVAANMQHALLTGAAGFLGIYLLHALLSKAQLVTCLLRGRDEATVLKTLQLAAEKSQLDIDWSRVRVLLGDLGAAKLALSEDVLGVLAESIDTIVHCGAWVHHRYSYATLKATNVDATVELLRLALRGKRKRFCFVSTESVGDAMANIDHVSEAILDIDAHPPIGEVGYLLTKWAAEQLVADASRKYGLHAVIARAGNITGDSRTGYSNFDHNHFWLFAKCCVQLGAYPDILTRVEMTPVDCVAANVVGLTLAPPDGLRVANLSNPLATTLPEFFEHVARAGNFATQRDTTAQWQEKLAHIDEHNALWQIRDLYAGDLSGEPVAVDHQETTRCLAAAAVPLAPAPNILIPRYVTYLQHEGFLPSA